MTRIRDVSLTRVRLGFRDPVWFGGSTREWAQAGVIRLTSDDGLMGLGEIAGPVLPATVETIVRRVARGLVGRDIQGGDDPVDADSGPVGAAIDCAVLDIVGQQTGRSMADVLGGGRDSVALNALLVIGRSSPALDSQAALALVAAGFQTIKLKLGVRGLDRAASLRAIRAAVGSTIALRLDLNETLSEAQAVSWLAPLDDLDLEYVEQPIPASLGVGSMARVRRAIPMPLALDESVAGTAAARALIDAGACDVLVVKPSRVGGPRASMRIVADAGAAGVAVTLSTLYETGIGVAAALQVAATLSADRAHGLATQDLLATDLIHDRLEVLAGRMTLPSRSGLGVTLDQDAFTHAALTV